MSAATVAEHFEASRQCAEEMFSWLEGPEAAALAHAELEDQLDARGRELLRRMLQDHLSLRAVNEVRMEGVVDSDGVAHGAVETPVTAARSRRSSAPSKSNASPTATAATRIFIRPMRC